MNEHAQALGRLAKGHPKHITPIDRERRRKLLAEARKRRWLPKGKTSVEVFAQEKNK
jgi:hypothetical protein